MVKVKNSVISGYRKVVAEILRPNACQCAAATDTQSRANLATKALNRPSAPVALLEGRRLARHTPNPMASFYKRNTLSKQRPVPTTTRKRAWCRCRGQGDYTVLSRLQQQNTLNIKTARGPYSKQTIHSKGTRLSERLRRSLP